MKSQFSCILFSLLVAGAACGGERGEKRVSKLEDSPKAYVEEAKQEPVVKSTPVVEIAKTEAMPTKYEDIMTMGKGLAAKGEHPKARGMFEAAAKLDKKKSEPHIELARSFIATNERANAIKSANKAVKLDPESSQAYNTLGRAELLRHNYENAIEAFRQATELNEDNIWAWNNLGFTYMTLKKYQEAADALVEATSRKGTTGYMWNNLGLAYEQLDDLDNAREAFEKGAELGSTEAVASRKRLEGVTTIVVMKTDTIEKPELETDPESKPESVEEKTFEINDEMPEMPEGAAVDELDNLEPDVEPEPEVEPTVEEPTVEEPKVETETKDSQTNI